MALDVINVLLKVLQLAWHSFESVAAQLFFDMLVKMTVLDEINFKIKESVLGMQTVSKYFGFHELPPYPKRKQ